MRAVKEVEGYKEAMNAFDTLWGEYVLLYFILNSKIFWYIHMSDVGVVDSAYLVYVDLS